MNQYTTTHDVWPDYCPGDRVPFIFAKGKLRPATFLGKSDSEVLVEYWVGDTYYIVKVQLGDEVLYPQQGLKKASYDLKYWKRNENFSLLENSALNKGKWHGEVPLYDVYDSERMRRRALIKPMKTVKPRKVKKIAQWAVGVQQLELEGFEAIAREPRLSQG